MIKVVLKSFPEAVIIHELNKDSGLPTIKFANDVAKSDILNNFDPEECELYEENLTTKVILNEEVDDFDLTETLSVSTFFKNEVNRIDVNNEVICNIKIQKENINNIDEAKWFIVKNYEN